MKLNLSILAFLSAACLVLTACRPKPGGSNLPPGMMAIQVVTTEAKRQAVSDTLSLVGSFAANEWIELKAETEGVVQEILFQEGQPVKKDQLLIRLDDTKLAATLAETEANFRLSEATFARSQQLFRDKLVSQQEYDQAAATFERTRATVDLMKRQLKDARICAPFAGIAGARNLSPGQVITRATVITTLVDLDPVKLEFYVPEWALSQVQIGQNLEISVAAYPDRKFNAKVYFVSPKLDEATRRALLKAEVANPKHELKPGMFANLDLTLQLRDSAIVIPELALMWDGDSARVFVVDANHTAELRPVKVGIRLPGLAEITGGLKAGEQVITEGVQKVVPGAQVRVAGPPPAAPGAPPPAAAPAAPKGTAKASSRQPSRGLSS